MLADFLYQFKNIFFGFNLFRYITVRAAFAAITALLFSLFIGPKIIRLLQRHQIGEEIRTDGPQTHLKKAGTPTMGGIIILAGVIIGVLLWARITNFYIQLIFISTLWMGAVGFLDDYLKAVKKIKKGLVGRYKLVGQITLGLLIGSLIYFNPYFNLQGINSNTSVPFFKNLEIDFGIFYIFVVMLVITGTSNAINLTDGLDGLATGLFAITALAFAGVSYVTGNVKISDYLNIIYLPGSGELTVYCLAMFGAAMGFLWYNAYPAQVFMGDTGALALGSTLGTLAVLVKKEILLVLIGGVFVAEALSVIIQTSYFKFTRRKYGEGRRVFKMAPLHHHFELKGWHEAKVVTRLWIIGILLALFSLTTFKIR
ncbi:phospho-N-acetylmuramoyl-pentapeptide-transferase [candidate division KSB1 bacterium 4484_188]|nr:MAG: phospho-N-acetylmuramoyl-pentapeptide-transferase [candidate division KSB1 bacterium 4484_188]HFE64145.1 phospho-N-acetylmuramoyl-pentapeptide-transferase [Caldithrix sp.]